MQKYLLISLQELQLRFSPSSPHIDNNKTVYYVFSVANSSAPNNKFGHHLSDAAKYISQDVGPMLAQEYKLWRKEESNTNSVKIVELNNSIVMDISAEAQDNGKNGTEYTLCIQRFQNNMPQMVFKIGSLGHQLLSTDSSNKKIFKKKQQTKQNQILTFQITLLEGQQQLIIKQRYIPSILQHYLLFDTFSVSSQQEPKYQRRPEKQGHHQYYSLVAHGKTKADILQEYCMPTEDKLHKNKIQHYNICLQIPNLISFRKYVDRSIVARSKKYKTQELLNSPLNVELEEEGSKNSHLRMNLRWGINLEDIKPEHNVLADAHEVLIYDVQIKFQKYNEHSSSKLKIIYGNKAYDLGGELSSVKTIKIKKMVHIRVKSEEEEIIFGVEKNLKIVAQSRFYTDELIAYSVNYPKRKLIDNAGKNIGFIKFKCQKAKNLSLPYNNSFWKQGMKKRYPHPITLSISQISANYIHDEPIEVVIKTDSQQKSIKNVPNMNHYNGELETYAEENVVNVKPDESVYMLVKSMGTENNDNDFIGITLLNFNEILMGENPLQLPFFKNQQKTVILNFVINKIVNYAFVKSVFQPEFLSTYQLKTITVSLFIKKIAMSPYFYTFQYMKKTQIYGAFNVNRQKKVLILEPSAHNQLELIASASSDNLNFIIEQTQFIIIKIIIFVADLGQDHEVYGTATIKLRSSDIVSHQKAKLSNSKMINFNNIPLKSLYGIEVGQVSFEVYQGAMENSHRVDTHNVLETPKPRYNKETKKIQQILHKSVGQQKKSQQSETRYRDHYFSSSKNITNKTIQLQIEDGSYAHELNKSPKQKVKLPLIKEVVKKEKKKDNYEQFLKMMQIRRRGATGNYEDGNSLGLYKNSNKNKEPVTEKRPRYERNKTPALNNSSIIKIERENPNLNRNLQLLFPKKLQRREQIKQQINIYQEKLQGLRSVLNQISQDIQEIEPTIYGDKVQSNPIAHNAYKNQQNEYELDNKSKQKLFRQIEDVELLDNQFAMNH